jgi:hypothetical protein
VDHLTLDELGDVNRARLHPHVAGCAQCQAVLDEQQAVRALLGALPAPGAAPPDVVLALERALAGAGSPVQREHRPAEDPLVTLVRLGPPATHPPSRRRRAAEVGGRWVLALAASAAVVLSLGQLADRAGSADSPAGAASSAGGDSSESADAQSGTARSSGASASAAATVTTGTRYTRETITAQARTLLTTRVPLAATGTNEMSAQPRVPGLQACLSAIQAGVTPVAVDVAAFEGRPATIVVVPVEGGREVWVVPRSCRAAGAATLFRARLP